MKRKSVILMLVLVLVFAFVSCGRDKDDNSDVKAGPSGLVIIIGNHANMVNRVDKIFDDILNEEPEYFSDAYTLKGDGNDVKYSAKANIAVVVADGNPQIEDLENYDFKTGYLKESDTAKKTQDNINKNNRKLSSLLASGELRAKEDEVDLIGAFEVAENYLKNLKDVSERRILVIDTMLPSTGLVDFTELDYANKSGQEIYDLVMSANGERMPDLSGLKIRIEGAINICGLQNKEISETSTSIIDFWKIFFGESLDGDIKNCFGLNGTEMTNSEDGEGYPYVSPIPVPARKPTSGKENSAPVVLDAETLKFKQNLATFENPIKAKNYIKTTVKKAIETMLAYDPDRIIYVVGSIAVDSKHNEFDTHRISRDRALAVADVLINECKIPSSNIKVLDCGTNKLSWRDTDEFANGKWQDSLAAKNRVVAIIYSDKNSDAYKDIKPYINDKHIVPVK